MAPCCGARFLRYTLEGRVLDGRDQPFAPHYQLGLWAQWQHPGGFFARADWQAGDGFYFSASHDERAAPRRLLDLRVGYEAGHWSASLWMRNALDERHAVEGVAQRLADDCLG